MTLGVCCQIRLPSGRVLRHSLPSSALLSDVAQFVMTSAPKLTNISLVQVEDNMYNVIHVHVHVYTCTCTM